MNKNYYDILGVSKDASKDDIKKAFKKMAVKWHPDRFAGKSDEEKHKAEEKFKEINEANEILSDDEKRAHYDRFGTMDNFGQGGMPGGGFGDMFGDMFGRFFGGSSFTQQAPQQGQSIKIQIPVNIEDLFRGATRKFKYKRNVRCSNCHGVGGEGVETCKYCHGTGMITTTQRTAFGIIQNSHPCEHCHGTGKTVKNTCKKCHGTGFTQIDEEIEITIPVGVKNGNLTQMTGKGHDAKSPSAVAGNLIIQYVYSFDEDHYAVDGYNVYEKINVPYYTCIIGGKINVTMPTGKDIEINVPSGSNTGEQIILKHKGIRNGDYIFVIQVDMPNSVDAAEEDLLHKIAYLHS